MFVRTGFGGRFGLLMMLSMLPAFLILPLRVSLTCSVGSESIKLKLDVSSNFDTLIGADTFVSSFGFDGCGVDMGGTGAFGFLMRACNFGEPCVGLKSSKLLLDRLDFTAD